MEKFVHIEHRVTPQHVINCTGQFLGQHGQRCARAVFFLQAREVFLARRIVPQKQDGGFRKRPVQVGVTDLGTRGAVSCACGFIRAFDQAAIGDKILHPWETLDVMNLVEQNEAQDFSDPGHDLEQVQGLGIVLLCRFDNVSFHIAEEMVVVPDQREVDFHALLDGRIGKALGDADTIGFVGELFPDLGQVILTVGIVDVGE